MLVIEFQVYYTLTDYFEGVHMPRERASDYESKTRHIKDMAAKHFAKTGYPAAKLVDIAKSCGVSKSMLYHYFPTKEDLLCSMINEHLDEVLFSLEKIEGTQKPVAELFNDFLIIFLQKSVNSRQRNIVAMSEAKYLPQKHLKKIREKELEVLKILSTLLKKMNPKLEEKLYKPYALMLIGILNWTDTWFDSSGPLSRESLVERVGDLFLNGFLQSKK